MKYAIRLAKRNKGRWQHAAIIVKGGRVLASAMNSCKNVPRNISPEHVPQMSQHAEIAALKMAGPSAKGATMYVARVNRSGDPTISKPCDNCQAALLRAGIKRVEWTT